MAIKALLCLLGRQSKRTFSLKAYKADDDGCCVSYSPITDESLTYLQKMLKAREQSATNLAPRQNRKRSRIQRVALYCTRNRPTNKRDVRDVFGVRFDSTTDETVLTAVDHPAKPVETARETCQIDIDQLSEDEQKRLQPLLWLELASLFDKNHVSLDKRKPFKRKRKEEGNVFGVSLNALVRRDQQVTGEDTTLVPLVLQAILAELAVRGAREEGILRVPGHKQKTEALYNEIEHNFYSKPEKIDPLIKKAGVHDLSALLKRWLRELPQPLLANDLVHLFYQTNVLPPHDQYKALAVLCQLLPHENRNTLRELLNFFRRVVELQDLNKMSQQNVATIIAPSFFPPRFVHPPDKNDIGAQVRMAAQCCHLTNVLITMTDSLWLVPQRLIEQGKMINKNGQPKRQLTRKAKNGSGSIISINRSATNGGDFVFDTNHIHRLVI